MMNRRSLLGAIIGAILTPWKALRSNPIEAPSILEVPLGLTRTCDLKWGSMIQNEHGKWIITRVVPMYFLYNGEWYDNYRLNKFYALPYKTVPPKDMKPESTGEYLLFFDKPVVQFIGNYEDEVLHFRFSK